MRKLVGTPHQTGDVRCVWRFLWWPVTLPIGDTQLLERRWFEWAVVRERYYRSWSAFVSSHWEMEAWSTCTPPGCNCKSWRTVTFRPSVPLPRAR